MKYIVWPEVSWASLKANEDNMFTHIPTLRDIAPSAHHLHIHVHGQFTRQFEDLKSESMISLSRLAKWIMDSVMFSLNSLTCRLIHSSRVLQVSTTACNLFSSRRGDPSNMTRYIQFKSSRKPRERLSHWQPGVLKPDLVNAFNQRLNSFFVINKKRNKKTTTAKKHQIKLLDDETESETFAVCMY